MHRKLVVVTVVGALVGIGSVGAFGEGPFELGKWDYPEARSEESDAAPLARGPDVPGVESSPWDDVDRNRIFDEVDALLAHASGDATFPVIVMLNARPSDEEFERFRADLGGFALKSNKDVDEPDGRLWDVIPAFSADLTKGQIHAMARSESVKQIELDGEVHTLLNTATVESGVDKAFTSFGVNGDRNGNVKSFTKDDIVICVVDTGIYNAHNDLNQGQVIGWKDYVGTSTTPYDDNGHGTHVAGIAAGQGDSNSAYRGVAYGAALVGVKVLNSGGSGSETAIVNGINFCNNNRATYGIEILTMSIGGGSCTSGGDAMSSAVNGAWSNGLVVTIAMGNGGPGYCTVASPGSAANVISVGSMSDPKNAACTGYKGNGWYLSDFSSRGKTGDGRMKPEILAPGTCITSTWRTSTSAYATLSGTSMATPFIAGVAALMLDASPTLTNAAIKSRLMSTSADWGPDNQAAEPQSYDYGAGRVQAYEAVKNACGCSGTGPSNPAHFYRGEDLAGTGKYDQWSLTVTSTSWPVAASLIIPSASATRDFDMRLYAPSGTQIATSLGTTRQETISQAISSYGTGTYKVRVESYAGSGSYWLDVSAGASGISLTVDQ